MNEFIIPIRDDTLDGWLRCQGFTWKGCLVDEPAGWLVHSPVPMLEDRRVCSTCLLHEAHNLQRVGAQRFSAAYPVGSAPESAIPLPEEGAQVADPLSLEQGLEAWNELLKLVLSAFFLSDAMRQRLSDQLQAQDICEQQIAERLECYHQELLTVADHLGAADYAEAQAARHFE